MNIIYEFFSLIIRGFDKMQPIYFFGCILGAAIFSAITGFYWFSLSRKKNKNSPIYLFLLGINCLFTFLSILIFIGVGELKETSKEIISKWNEDLNENQEFINSVFEKVYYNVKDLNIENFDSYETPENGGTYVPTTEKESKLVAGQTYYEEAVNNFEENNFLLSRIIKPETENVPEMIEKDMNRHFKKKNESYNVRVGIELASNILTKSLLEQMPQVVNISRALCGLLYLLIQLIFIFKT